MSIFGAISKVLSSVYLAEDDISLAGSETECRRGMWVRKADVGPPLQCEE